MNILITGGTGLVGTRLTELLIEQGHSVWHLSRKAQQRGNVKTFVWDIDKGFIDEEALLGADYIIHLAGAGIADERWTPERKKEIIDSRTKSLGLISQKLKTLPHKIQGFVSASGIGFYGTDTGSTIITEESPAGNDFVAECCILWEKASEPISELGIRTTKLRIGIVLTDKGGALPKMATPTKFGFGAPLGTGEQFLSWIHIDDLCRLFIHALFTPSIQGVFNAVADNPVNNRTFNQVLARVLNRPLWLPNVPSFVLKAVFGEMVSIVLGGNYVSNKKLKNETSFQFQFNDLETALRDIFKK